VLRLVALIAPMEQREAAAEQREHRDGSAGSAQD
jgi:hypothetical protein